MAVTFNIQKPDSTIIPKIKEKIDGKTKPLGALGRLEDIAMQVGTIQQRLNPTLQNPRLVIFAADHGIATEGVSAYPQEVTRQMVINFVEGGAAINVFARQHGIGIDIVDAGVKGEFDDPVKKLLINNKIGKGTASFLGGPAMTLEECHQAMKKGAECITHLYRNGCNVTGFGEMGIGNTSSSTLLMHLLTGESLDVCIGRGTGLDDEGLQRKNAILSRSLSHCKNNGSVLEILARYGGFETAMMVGAFLQAAENKMTILVDGFNVTAALLVACKLYPVVAYYCLFTHQSGENGHKKLLEYLKARPLLDLNMRLGEGTGAAIAYPIVQSAVHFLNDMASFEKAGVSENSNI